MPKAYEALDEATREKMDGLVAYHSIQYGAARRTGQFPEMDANLPQDPRFVVFCVVV